MSEGSDKAESAPVVSLFGRWRNAYLFVVVVFIVEVAFFYFISHYFA